MIKIGNWITKNKKKIYIIGSVLFLLLLFSPYFITMPELMFGLLGGALVGGFFFNKVINNMIERRTIKLHVKEEGRTEEPGITGDSTGNRRARTPKRTGIAIPGLESDESDGKGVSGNTSSVGERSSETEVSGEYAGQDRVQDTDSESIDESKLLDRGTNGDTEQNDGRDESKSGQDMETSESTDITIPDIE